METGKLETLDGNIATARCECA